MTNKILVTGGAGFIGSYLVDNLINEGHDVSIFDNLEPQVHKKKPEYVNTKAKFIQADILDYDTLKNAVLDHEIIFHDAAMVGVGQSMYDIRRYVQVNTLGTANLLDILANNNHDVKKVIVAGSMSSYGEGAYINSSGERIRPKLRSFKQLSSKEWEIKDPSTQETLKPVGVTEEDQLMCNSIYAITKTDQEEMVLNVCDSYDIPAVALRYFNVFGPRQSLSNPYTGVAAIFMSRIKNNRSPLVFEDGLQSRDFISVHDIANANILAMKSRSANGQSFNVGAGRQISIKKMAEIISTLYKKDIKPDVVGKFRKGDVRHCFADISKIKSMLGFEPKVSFEDGMKELIIWADSSEAEDKVEVALKELEDHKLLH